MPLAHNRDYVLLWTGGAASVLGSQMSTVAYPLLVLALTGSAVRAGLVGTVALLGRIVFRLPAGALVDRWDRRKIMLAADTLRGAALASIAIALGFGDLGFTQLLAAAFVENAIGELFRPAATAAVRRVIDPAQMAEAISRIQARAYGAAIAGPPLGGLLFSLGRFLPFAADAASYAYSFISTLCVRTPMGVGPAAPDDQRDLIGELTGGLRWIWSRSLIRTMMLSAAGANVVFAALNLAVIVAARDHGATTTQVGVMLAIASGGGFVGALLAARLAAYRRPSQIILGIFWATAVVIPLMAIDQDPYLLGALLGIAMVLAPTANTILISHQIALTPDRIQGRVDAAGYFIVSGASPFAPLAAGLLLRAIGAPDTLLVIAAAMAATTLAVTLSHTMRAIPHLRDLVAGERDPAPQPRTKEEGMRMDHDWTDYPSEAGPVSALLSRALQRRGRSPRWS